jgi:hypothetical protein
VVRFAELQPWARAHVFDRDAELGGDAMGRRAALEDGVVDGGRVGVVGAGAGPVSGGDPAGRCSQVIGSQVVGDESDMTGA